MIKKLIWTLEEATAVLPRLKLILGEQMARADEIERMWRTLRKRGLQKVELGDYEVADHRTMQSMEQELNGRLAEYEAGWRVVVELGVTVKDPRTGLCDFYGHVEGRPVWLCWRYGEDGIDFYHDLDAGFAGRKPLEASIRRRMLN